MQKPHRWQQALGGFLAATLVAVFAIGTVSAQGGGGSGGTATADPEEPGQVILKLNNAADLPIIAAQYALNPVPLDQLTIAPLYLMGIADGASADVRAAALSTDSRVVYAEANVIGATPEDQGSTPWAAGGGSASYLSQWAPPAIRLAQAQNVTRGAGVVVAVLDTGVDATHPALTGHLTPGYDFVDNDTDPSEVGVAGVDKGYGHGTFVTGLVVLAAPGAQIMPVRILDPSGTSDVWRLAKAIVWAATQGAQVINLSLATYTHTHIAGDLITDVTSGSFGRGVVVVAAAGNAASNVPQYPAAEGGSRVLSVGASSPNNVLATFSDYGSWVRVLAPGASIYSTVPGGQYATWSGTSMSTALVSGQAALVRAYYPTMSSQDVIGRIGNTSTKISGPVQLLVNVGASVGQ